MIGRIAAWTGIGVVVLAGAFVAWIYAASEAHFHAFPEPPPFTHPIATDEAAVARGGRLVRTRGCMGCHGENLGGEAMGGDFVSGTARGANLTLFLRDEGVDAFEAAVRHGIGPDGRALWSMPSFNFVHLRDGDVADIIAYVRAQPIVEKRMPASTLGVPPRLAVALGQDSAMPKWVASIPPLKRTGGDPQIARGEYLAMTACIECHGFTLSGDMPWGGDAPDLTIAASYSLEDFRTLMKTGKATGDRELRMMSGVARGRYSQLTPDEVDDLHAFLRARSEEKLREAHIR